MTRTPPIKALVYFENPICELEGSVLKGEFMKSLIFGEDSPTIHLHTVPNVGDYLHLIDESFEFQVKQVLHCATVSRPEHFIKILVSQVQMSDWTIYGFI
ncbi:hypothetical protein [Anabaena sp. CCY 9402-a]|uniref:hypothetical protein n=1 Tax=Anabaena sp. CCY 9402-a TaxID=3103867 RepID=UPI0039C619CB